MPSYESFIANGNTIERLEYSLFVEFDSQLCMIQVGTNLLMNVIVTMRVFMKMKTRLRGLYHLQVTALASGFVVDFNETEFCQLIPYNPLILSL